MDFFLFHHHSVVPWCFKDGTFAPLMIPNTKDYLLKRHDSSIVVVVVIVIFISSDTAAILAAL